MLFRFGLGVLFALTFPGCRRPLPAGGADETPDSGHVSAPPDASDAVRADTGDSPGRDAARDLADDDVAGGACPTGVAAVDVCGCGCCGDPGIRTCYYPALGESRETIPNPIPPPSTCNAAGCSLGTRYLCCADPGAAPSSAEYCASGTAEGDLPRLIISRRDGATCTTLELSAVPASSFPITAPSGYQVSGATRGACDGWVSPVPAHAIDGLGSVSYGHIKHGDPSARYDVHVVLFFDTGGATAEAVRLDVDDIRVSAGICFVCVTCGGETDAGGDRRDAGDDGARDGGCVPGDAFWDGCNVCSCGPGGIMLCSERACPVADDGGAS